MEERLLEEINDVEDLVVRSADRSVRTEFASIIGLRELRLAAALFRACYDIESKDWIVSARYLNSNEDGPASSLLDLAIRFGHAEMARELWDLGVSQVDCELFADQRISLSTFMSAWAAFPSTRHSEPPWGDQLDALLEHPALAWMCILLQATDTLEGKIDVERAFNKGLHELKNCPALASSVWLATVATGEVSKQMQAFSVAVEHFCTEECENFTFLSAPLLKTSVDSFFMPPPHMHDSCFNDHQELRNRCSEGRFQKAAVLAAVKVASLPGRGAQVAEYLQSLRFECWLVVPSDSANEEDFCCDEYQPAYLTLFDLALLVGDAEVAELLASAHVPLTLQSFALQEMVVHLWSDASFGLKARLRKFLSRVRSAEIANALKNVSISCDSTMLYRNQNDYHDPRADKDQCFISLLDLAIFVGDVTSAQALHSMQVHAWADHHRVFQVAREFRNIKLPDVRPLFASTRDNDICLTPIGARVLQAAICGGISNLLEVFRSSVWNSSLLDTAILGGRQSIANVMCECGATSKQQDLGSGMLIEQYLSRDHRKLSLCPNRVKAALIGGVHLGNVRVCLDRSFQDARDRLQHGDEVSTFLRSSGQRSYNLLEIAILCGQVDLVRILCDTPFCFPVRKEVTDELSSRVSRIGSVIINGATPSERGRCLETVKIIRTFTKSKYGMILVQMAGWYSRLQGRIIVRYCGVIGRIFEFIDTSCLLG